MEAKWTASDAMSYNTYADSYMLPSNLVVQDGVLNITAKKQSHQGSTYTGGQLTSWNRVCFQGGYLEVRFKPAVGQTKDINMDGLWPAVWSMGNLLRDNYMIRNRHMWPYSYSDCPRRSKTKPPRGAWMPAQLPALTILTLLAIPTPAVRPPYPSTLPPPSATCLHAAADDRRAARPSEANIGSCEHWACQCPEI